jgi:hypothetical protein
LLKAGFLQCRVCGSALKLIYEFLNSPHEKRFAFSNAESEANWFGTTKAASAGLFHRSHVSTWPNLEVRQYALLRRYWGKSGHRSRSRLMSTRPNLKTRVSYSELVNVGLSSASF